MSIHFCPHFQNRQSAYSGYNPMFQGSSFAPGPNLGGFAGPAMPTDSSSLSGMAMLFSMFQMQTLFASLMSPQNGVAMPIQNPQFGTGNQNYSAGGRGAVATRPTAAGRATGGSGDLSRLGPSTYDNIIREAAAKHNVDPALIKAVIKKESSFRPRAGSHAGAQGLMQLMPGTFREMGGGDPHDPRTNIMAGTKYLSRMLRRHNGDVTLALASYNAGPGNVRKYGGVPPFRETQNYVRVVTRDYQRAMA